MTILTESERVIAEVLADKGYSWGEIAHKLLERRNRSLQVDMTKEVAALFGRRVYPIDREISDKDKLAKQLFNTEHGLYDKEKRL